MEKCKGGHPTELRGGLERLLCCILFNSYIVIWISSVIDPYNMFWGVSVSTIVRFEAAYRWIESSTRGTAEDFIVCKSRFLTCTVEITAPCRFCSLQLSCQDAHVGKTSLHPFILCNDTDQMIELLELQNRHKQGDHQLVEAPCSLPAFLWVWE